jgi:lysophospholipase L1-like esterase
VSPDHPQAAALRALFARLAEARGTRSVVFYVGENVDAIAQQLDRPRFEEQRRRFVEMAQGLAAGHDNVRFVAIDAEPLRGEYSDHVHLTAEGYRRVAERLRDEVEATGWVVDRR